MEDRCASGPLGPSMSGWPSFLQALARIASLPALLLLATTVQLAVADDHLPVDGDASAQLPGQLDLFGLNWGQLERVSGDYIPGYDAAAETMHGDFVRLAAYAQAPGADSTQPAASPNEDLQTAESLGNAPEAQPLQFLRRVTPLLQRGQWQFDVGVSYVLAETNLPVVLSQNLAGPGIGLDPAQRIRQRLLMVPFEFRYGLTNRLQLFVFAPVGWANNELTRYSFDGTSSFFDQRTDNVGGIGDVSAGGTFLLRRGDNQRPDIVGTLLVTAPTGNNALPISRFSPESSLGQGFWAIGGNLLAVHTYDPVVLYYGVGARYRFEEEFLGGIVVDPGEEYSYQLGVGFAANSRVTLSTTFLGSYIVEDRINSQRIEGGNLEPLRLRFAVTLQQPCRICEPFATIGMTDDAPGAHVGITWTY